MHRASALRCAQRMAPVCAGVQQGSGSVLLWQLLGCSHRIGVFGSLLRGPDKEAGAEPRRPELQPDIGGRPIFGLGTAELHTGHSRVCGFYGMIYVGIKIDFPLKLIHGKNIDFS